MTQLSQRKCVPCEGIGEALPKAEAEKLLSHISDWQIDSEGRLISKDLILKNFMTAVRMINKIAEIAETENHHPDIHLTSYKKLRIELSTHALGGLSENDFILAAKINEITK